MGTNYYWHMNPCPHCGHPEEKLHIGKSSAGWCFSLHIIPERGINDLDDWKELWKEGNGKIIDEYSEEIPIDKMLEIITDFGPNGLLRHKVDGKFCVGNGKGTWDLIRGEFF